MADVNVMDFVDESGKFTDGFKDQIGSIAGDEFKGTKMLDDIHDVPSVIKSFLHTKRDYGKKLEGVITKPGEGASDEDRANYRTALLKELGTPESADDYEFPKTEEGSGLTFNENLAKMWREFFHSKGWPVDMVKDAAEFMYKSQAAMIADRRKEQQDALEKDMASFKKDFRGDNLVKAGRIAHNAIMTYATDDLKNLLRENKVYDSAGDLELWHKTGFTPTQLRIWEKIGNDMKVSEAPSDEGGKGSGSPESDVKKTAKKLYDHPTSKELFQAGGAK
jgi:hypothetical protein